MNHHKHCSISSSEHVDPMFSFTTSSDQSEGLPLTKTLHVWNKKTIPDPLGPGSISIVSTWFDSPSIPSLVSHFRAPTSFESQAHCDVRQLPTEVATRWCRRPRPCGTWTGPSVAAGRRTLGRRLTWRMTCPRAPSTSLEGIWPL